MEKCEENDDSSDSKVQDEGKLKINENTVDQDKDKSRVASEETETVSSAKENEDIKKESVDSEPERTTENTEAESLVLPSSLKDSSDPPKVDSKVKVKREKTKEHENEKDSVRKKDAGFDKSDADRKMDKTNKEQKVPPLKLSVSGVSSGASAHNPPATTASHLYSVLMAPLDSRSPYQTPFHLESDAAPRKRIKLDTVSSDRAKRDSIKALNSKESISQLQGMDLSKNQKRKLKKKKRKHVLNKVELQRAKDFIYSSEKEQYSIEKLRTMIEDVTEFLDAIWDVYCSEARMKGESVEEEGYKAAAVLKCLSSSGEGSWADLQLLSRAKSVLVLRSKNLAASTISRVENELGYEPDIRNFIVHMLRFWMNEVVPKA